ncbi:MAG: DNA polymerase/3'-5' exonuclease PolX [Planctomycetota bacterium]
MKNKELAQMFETIADVLEIQGELVFKVRSYRKAARVLNDLTEDVETLSAEGRLDKVGGIGKATAEKIEEYLKTGKMKRYEEAVGSVPAGLLDMLKIPGMGPKTVALVNQKLKIESIAALAAAAKDGRLAALPGMGAKKVENILHGIELMQKASGRMLLGEAMPIVRGIVEAMKQSGHVAQIEPAGSLRRWKETIGDMDILAAGKEPQKIVETFTKGNWTIEVIASGKTKASIRIGNNFQVDMRVVDAASFGSALQYFTGSKAHNVKLRDIAKAKGLKLNEYGVFKGEKQIAGRTEEEVYKAVGLPWIPPTLREDRGEIEAAQEGKLPRLVQLPDIQGDLHVHSKWSDGHATIEEAALSAEARGYKYIAIADHTDSLRVFGGLSAEEVYKKKEEIEQLRKKIKGIQILCGVEVDIKSDGALDYSDDVLKDLDVVTASIHSGFQQDEAKMTRRILSAMENPYVHIIGHPTGRLLNQREPYALDMDAVLKKAAETGTAMEVNAHYQRLDLSDVACRRAKELGVKIAICTDTHHLENLDLMEYGIAVAQRGWLEKDDVINTWPIKKLQEFLHAKR